jgi:hypothetical protein
VWDNSGRVLEAFHQSELDSCPGNRREFKFENNASEIAFVHVVLTERAMVPGLV